MSLLTQQLWAQYNPDNPGDPDVYYNLTLTASPSAGGIVSPSGKVQAAEGTVVACVATANNGYQFVWWTADGEVVSTEAEFEYVMPAGNTILTAVFEWKPDSPEDPDSRGYSHKINLYASPAAGGYFDTTTLLVVEGDTAKVLAYPNAGYRFESWVRDGEVVSAENPAAIVMGTEDISLTARFAYSPDNPGQPLPGYFNRETGELYVDNAEAGTLSSAISQLVGSDEYTLVTSLRVTGSMSASDFGFAQTLANCLRVNISQTTGLTVIPANTFWGASALEDILLPQTVERIDSCAFMGCAALQSFTIPASVGAIGEKAFAGCASLTTVTTLVTMPFVIADNVFDTQTYSTAELMVPPSTLRRYQSTAAWNRFERITPDESVLTKGDANGDGEVNITDAEATVTNILGEETEDPFYRNAADMNADGEIDIFDVTLIVGKALNGNITGSARSDVSGRHRKVMVK